MPPTYTTSSPSFSSPSTPSFFAIRPACEQSESEKRDKRRFCEPGALKGLVARKDRLRARAIHETLDRKTGSERSFRSPTLCTHLPCWFLQHVARLLAEAQ